QASHIRIVEAVSFARKGFDQPDHALLGRQGYGNHGAGAQGAAGLGVDPGVGFRIIATHGLAAAQAGAGKAGVGIDSGAAVGSDFAGRGAADNGVVFGKRDGDAAGAGDRDGTIGNQLQDLIQSEFFFFGESG